MHHICKTIHVIPIKGSPIKQQFDTFYHVIVGDTFSLNCTATDNPNSPEITYSWYRNNEDITHLTKILASNKTAQYRWSTSQLYIEQLDPDQHNGRYMCVANNEAISTTTVIVES